MAAAEPTAGPTTLVTIRVPTAMKERYDWMAGVLARSRNYVFVEALQRYLDEEEWQLKDILEAVAESSHDDGVAHEDVMREAWETVERARAQEARRNQTA
jgi:predicted transcriptional regulator